MKSYKMFQTKHSEETRTLRVLGVNKNFSKNQIISSRYTLITFLPIFIFYQFKKSTNIYFLFVSLIQQIPGVSPLGKYISLGSLLAVLTVLAFKEIFEDIKRHQSDSTLNNQKCQIFRKEWIVGKWKDVVVGDIVKVESSQTFPVDLILLTTSEPNHICYIQTSSLDGETNYKLKNSHPDCLKYSTELDWNNKIAFVKCDAPNKELYRFNGLITIDIDNPIPVNHDQLIFRGSKLKSTEWAIGIAIYTGNETKIMMNSSSTVIKRSSIDEKIDKLIYFLFGIMVLLTIISAILCEITYNNVIPSHWYMSISPDMVSWFFTILTFFILYHNFVPISLLVCVELVKFLQANLINFDPLMHAKKTINNRIVKTSSIIEDLGHVNYIFTDKTGTLTRNKMILREFSVEENNFILNSEFKQDLMTNELIYKKSFYLFIMNLLICNSIVPEVVHDKNHACFQSSSPDETAIVSILYDFGFKFISRNKDGIEIDYLGNKEFWRILKKIEFTSERQRMTVLVESPLNECFLFIKGADSIIFSRLKNNTNLIFEKTANYLETFAKKGLRTLCVAYKEMNENEKIEAMADFEQATATVENREKFIYEVSDKLETDLNLLGCTGIEDKLQKMVAESLKSLRDGGIKIWMLTGDRIETAINIGYACNLLNNTWKLRIIDSKNQDDCLEKLKKIANIFKININTNKIIKNPKLSKDLALAITGQDLKYILSPECEDYFLNIAVYCKTVICSRISPSQKQEITLLIKNRVKNTCTLAIGDGANDCSMIRAAHVGVGILGKEGCHAANTADFAIQKFEILTRLLFYHGAASYRRICNCVNFLFYKNFFINVMPFFNSFFNLYSGSSIVDKFNFPLINNFYTVLPVFCFGLLDRAASIEAAANIPYLFKSIRKSYTFNSTRFILWIFNACLHSFLVYFFSYFTFYAGTFDFGGIPITKSLFSTFIIIQTTIVISLKAALEIRNWNFICQIGIWGGIFIHLFFVFIFSRKLPKKIWLMPENYNHDILFITSPIFWFSLFLPFVVILPDFIYHCIRNSIFTPSHISVSNRERREEIDWSHPSIVESVLSDISALTSQKNKIKRKYCIFSLLYSRICIFYR